MSMTCVGYTVLGRRETRAGPRFELLREDGEIFNHFDASKVSDLVRVPYLKIKAPACKSALTSMGNIPNLLASPIELALLYLSYLLNLSVPGRAGFWAAKFTIWSLGIVL